MFTKRRKRVTQLLVVILEFQELLEKDTKHIKVFWRITSDPSAFTFLRCILNPKTLSILSSQNHFAYIGSLISCKEAYKSGSLLPVQECLHTALYIVHKKRAGTAREGIWKVWGKKCSGRLPAKVKHINSLYQNCSVKSVQLTFPFFPHCLLLKNLEDIHCPLSL